jgi:uncharacterized protein (TIGR02001 family)
MRKIIIASVVAGAFALPAFNAAAADAAPAAAPAPTYTFTGNVMLATEYNYRGISQTNGLPAVQGGFDYSHASGLYVGVWGSNISWISDQVGGSEPIELDLYGGYKNSFAGGDWTYDVGVLTYNYPEKNFPNGLAKADTTEIYGAIGWKWLTLKYSHAVSSHIFGWTTVSGGDTSGSGYLDLTGTYDLGNGWGVSGHVGHQKIKDNGGASYSDYKLGVTKDVGFGVVGLNLIDTNAKGNCSAPAEAYCWAGRDQGKSTAVLSFSKTL